MELSSNHINNLPVSSDEILKKINKLDIKFDYYEHHPFKTVKDSKIFRKKTIAHDKGDAHIKNLFLRDKRKNSYLLVFLEDTKVDLKIIASIIKSDGNLSFGSPTRLFESLGVMPGAVTPLSMITGIKKNVNFFIEKKILKYDRIFMHPLDNRKTIRMNITDLEKFFDSFECKPIYLEI